MTLIAAALVASAGAQVQPLVLLDPGVYPEDEVNLTISGYEVASPGVLWWENSPNCSQEFKRQGKIGFRALPTSAPARLATSCAINPGDCTPARDEAYSYFFTESGGDVTLYRKPLGDPETDPGIPFVAGGQTISFPNTQSSRLWVEGSYLYYQRHWFANGTWSTRLYRALRDGNAGPQVFASIPGQEFITEFVPIVYQDFNPQVPTYRAGHLLLTASRILYSRDANGGIHQLRQNVYDLAVLPPDLPFSSSTIYTAENTGNMGDAVARLYEIGAISGFGALRKSWNGFHIHEVELANWPDDSPGRVFITRCISGTFGCNNLTCQRQLTKGSFDNWDQFLASNFEGRLKGSREWVYYVHDTKIKGKKSDAPPELIDVDYLGMEITQGVQSLAHDATLIAGKPTYVRGYARLSINTTTQSDWYTKALLYGTRGGNPLPGSPLNAIQQKQLNAAQTLPDQRNSDGGYLFELPASWTTAGNPSFSLRLNESGSVPETGGDGNNGFRTVNFVGKSNTCLKFRPLRTTAPPLYAGSGSAKLPEILQRCKSLLPISDFDLQFDNCLLEKPVFFIEVEYVVCFPFVCAIPMIKLRHDPFYLEDSSDNDGSWALFWLGVYRLFGNEPCADYHVVGAVHPNLPNFNGIGGRGGLDLTDLWDVLPPGGIPDTDLASVLAVTMRTHTPEWDTSIIGDGDEIAFNSVYGGRTLAHELGHNYGRKHVQQDSDLCGGSTPEGPFDTPPFPSCSFGRPSIIATLDTVSGFDTVWESPVRNDTNRIGDLMSYATARWTSVWAWNAVASKLPSASSGGAPGAPQPGAAPGEWIVVKGFYDTATGEAFLMPSEILPDGIISPTKLARSLAAEQAMPDGMPIELCQLNRAGQVLSTHKAVPFAMPREGDAPAGQLWFLQVIPCAPEMASLTLCDQSTPIAWLPRSLQPPRLFLDLPSVDATNELLHLSWNASDPDGSPLLFSVFYSPDDGASWRLLTSELDTTALTVSTRRLPGGFRTRFRVIACDGLDTAIAESAPFTVPLSPPEVTISNLPEHRQIPFGQPVRPLLSAWDEEDGVLDPQWDLAGPLSMSGNGESPSLRHLLPGSYLFTASSTDSHGNTTDEQRHFEVLPVVVPDTAPPRLDGYCADLAYDQATPLRMAIDSIPVTVNLVHADGCLYATLCDIPYAPGGGRTSIGLVIDTDGIAPPGTAPGAQERGFYVNDDGLPSQTQGTRGTMANDATPPLGFVTAVQRGLTTWSAEFCIDESLLGGWDHAARLLIDLDLGREAGAFWPADSDLEEPATWAPAWFGELPAPPNQAPVAAAPPQVVAVASQFESIFLDGAGSEDPEGDLLSFSWTQVGGPAVTLLGASPAQVSFAPPSVSVQTVLRFELTVSDGFLFSDPVQSAVILLPDPPRFQGTGGRGASLVLLDVESLADWNRVRAHFAGQPGQEYKVEGSIDGEIWSIVAQRTADATGRFTYDGTAGGARSMLYRAATIP